MTQTSQTDLPEIQFLQKSHEIKDVEIMTLKSLFRRKESLDHNITKPHRVHFNVLMFITEGEGKHFVDFQQFKLSRGSVIFISLQQIHSFDPKPNYDGYLIVFKNSLFFSNPELHFVFPPLGSFDVSRRIQELVLDNTRQLKLFRYLDDMYEEYNLPETRSKCLMVKSLLNLIMLQLMREILDDKTSVTRTNGMEQFDQFMNLLVSDIKYSRNAEYFAEKMDMSYRKLNELCRSITKLSVKEFIDQYVILECKRYLVTTNYSIKELSYKFGFDEPTNFLKYFKKREGVTPNIFRQNYLG